MYAVVARQQQLFIYSFDCITNLLQPTVISFCIRLIRITNSRLFYDFMTSCPSKAFYDFWQTEDSLLWALWCFEKGRVSGFKFMDCAGKHWGIARTCADSLMLRSAVPPKWRPILFSFARSCQAHERNVPPIHLLAIIAPLTPSWDGTALWKWLLFWLQQNRGWTCSWSALCECNMLRERESVWELWHIPSVFILKMWGILKDYTNNSIITLNFRVVT